VPKSLILAKKGQKGSFWAFLPKLPVFDVLGAFLGPWGLPGTVPGRWFYINPRGRSRRGLQGPGRPRKGLLAVPDPGKGSQRPGRAPGARVPGSGVPALGGFTSTPRAGALSPVPTGVGESWCHAAAARG